MAFLFSWGKGLPKPFWGVPSRESVPRVANLKAELLVLENDWQGRGEGGRGRLKKRPE